MKPRVLIRADAGKSVGFGHFVRSAALAAYLRDDFRVFFASFNPDGEPLSAWQLSQIKASGAEPLELAERLSGIEAFDLAFLDAVGEGDIVVLDNYYFSTAYQRKVRERRARLVCIDDMHSRHFIADVVMTFCPLVREDFSLERYTRFFGGIRWSFLRQPFLAPVVRRDRSKPVEHLVMAMGGADPFMLTPKMARAVRRVFPDALVSVIAGDTVCADSLADPGVRVCRRLDASEVADLFDSADLGIFPASTICVEAFARHLPVAAGHFVDNQEEFYEAGVREGWFLPLGCLLDSEDEIVSRLAEISRRLPGNGGGDIPADTPDFGFAEARDAIVDLFRSLAK